MSLRGRTKRNNATSSNKKKSKKRKKENEINKIDLYVDSMKQNNFPMHDGTTSLHGSNSQALSC